MKFSFFTTIILIFFFEESSPVLKGRYKIEYDKRFYLTSSIITIEDSSYVKRTLDNYYLNKGHIKYYNRIVTLKDENSNFQIEFGKDEIENDTIYFGTKNLKGTGVSYMEISVNSGKLIKIE